MEHSPGQEALAEFSEILASLAEVDDQVRDLVLGALRTGSISADGMVASLRAQRIEGMGDESAYST